MSNIEAWSHITDEDVVLSELQPGSLGTAAECADAISRVQVAGLRAKEHLSALRRQGAITGHYADPAAYAKVEHVSGSLGILRQQLQARMGFLKREEAATRGKSFERAFHDEAKASLDPFVYAGIRDKAMALIGMSSNQPRRP